MSGRINLWLGETLIQKVKEKSENSNQAISEFCRVILNAWQSGLVGYTKLNKKRNLPELPGVYIVFDNERVLYVGCSINIYQRLIGHEKSNSFFDVGGQYIFWILVDKNTRFSIEKICIQLLNPQMNRGAKVDKIEFRGQCDFANLPDPQTFLLPIIKEKQSPPEQAADLTHIKKSTIAAIRRLAAELGISQSEVVDRAMSLLIEVETAMKEEKL